MSNDEKRGLFAGALAGVIDRRDTISLLLRDYFNAEAVKHLSHRKLLISEDVIRSEVMHVDKVASVLKELHCGPDNIIVELQGKQRGVAFEAQIRLKIRELILTDSAQKLTVHVTEEKRPVGKNFLGKIVCGVGTALIGSLTSFALLNGNLGEHAYYDDDEKLITVRLGELPNVKRLLEPQVASWKDSVPLKWVGIEEAVHVQKGVEVGLIIEPAVKLMMQDLRPAKEVARELWSRLRKK